MCRPSSTNSSGFGVPSFPSIGGHTSTYTQLLAAAQCDPALSRAHLEQIIVPATVAGLARIARAKDSGQLRTDADPQAIIDMLYGAIYYRLLLHTRPLEPEQIDAALDVAFNGLR